MKNNPVRPIFLAFLLSLLGALPAFAQTFYVATNGSDKDPGTLAKPWQTIKKAADTLVAGQTVYIRAGTYKETVTATRSGTAAAGYITYSAYPGDAKPVLDGGGTSWIQFNINGQSYIRVNGLRLQNGGYKGVGSETSAGFSNIIVENCEIVNFPRPGISINQCSNALVKGNLLDNVVSSGAGECLTFENCEFVDVANNEVRNSTTSTKGGEGICIKASRNMRVYGNYVHDNIHPAEPTKRPAIYIDSYNGYQRDIEVFNNRVARCGSGIIITGELRNASDNVRIYNNIISDTVSYPLAVVEWGDDEVMTWPSLPLKDVIIENNTVVNSEWKDGWVPGLVIDTPLAIPLVVRNNLFVNFDPAISVNSASTGLSLVNNFANSRDGKIQSSLGSTGVTGDPKFVDLFYRIASDSAARGRGAVPTMAKFDYDFHTRPTGSACDIGADQYFPSGTTTQTVSISATSKPANFSTVSPLTSGTTDAAEATSSGVVSLSGNTVRVSYASASDRNLGAIRFSGVALPKGATVLGAWLTLNATSVTHMIGDDKKNKVDVIGIRAENTGNSAALAATAKNISSRARTTSFFNAYTKYAGSQKIGNLGNIITEVINRTDWVSGNALTLLLESYTVPCSLDFSTTESGAANAPVLTVEYTTGTNVAPVISNVTDQVVNANISTAALPFTISDWETPAGSLTVSAASSNTTLLPLVNIALGGSVGNRTVTLTPATNQSGSVTVTLTVSDGVLSTIDTFLLTVNPLGSSPIPLYWDANGATIGAGTKPSGTWGVSNFWSTSATGSLATGVYVSKNDVHFSAGSDASGSYTVTLSGSQSANSLTFGEGAVTVSGGTELLLTGSKGEVNVANALSASISSVVGGTSGLTKSGGGTLSLSGSNSYTGRTFINEGMLWVSSLANVGGGRSSLGSPVTADEGGISINDQASLCYDGPATTTNRNFVLGGTGGTIFNTGTGQLTLSGNITGSGQLVLRGDNAISVDGLIGDKIRELVKTDTNTVTLANAANSFLGSAYIYSGTLRVSSLADSGAVCALGKGDSVEIGQNSSPGVATLQYFGASSTTSNRTIRIASASAGKGGTLENTTPGTTLTLTGSVSSVAGAVSPTLTLTGEGSGVLGGAVSGNGLQINKVGAGIWTLANSANHSGFTVVSAGTLKVNGSLNAGALGVNAGARLSGSGIITIPSTISGTHAPGDGIGLQTLSGSLTYAAASHLEWELGSDTTLGAGTAYDKVAAATVTVSAGAVVDVVLNRAGGTVDFSTPFWSAPQSWVVLTATNLTGVFNLGSVTFDSKASAAENAGKFWLQQSSTGVNLMWTPKGMHGTMVGSSSWGSTDVRTGSSYSITGSGIGIAGTADSFWFESTDCTGNFQAMICFKGITTTGATPRAGLMLRESTAAGARFVMLASAPGTTTTYRMSARTTANAVPSAEVTPPVSYPYSSAWDQKGWMLLVRTGDRVLLATSANGVDFVDAGSYTLSSLAANVQIGMFVSSGSAGVTCTSNLSDFELVPLDAMPPYDAWAAGYTFAKGADKTSSGDPDGDGLANLIEYTLGLDPTVVNASIAQPSVVSVNGSNYLQLSVKRNSAVTNVLIEGQSTGTLETPNSWKAADTVNVVNTSSVFTVRDALPIGTNGKRFLRLRFTLVP